MKQHWPPSTQMSPLPAAIITACGKNGLHPNLMTASWTGIICSTPPMCYVSIRPERFTHHLVKESMEFAINLTTVEMARATDLVGIIGAKKENKWTRSGLTPCSAKIVSCPLIEESPLSLECLVKEIVSLGSHDMFIADIVSVAVDERFIDPETGKLDLAKAEPLIYSHGEYFSQGDFLGYFGWSVKKSGPIERRK